MSAPDKQSVEKVKPGGKSRNVGLLRSLSARLLLLTVIFIMVAEILIFVPSIANYRNLWLRNHLDIAEAASIVFLDSSDLMLSDEARNNLLETTRSTTVAVTRDGTSRLLASGEPPEELIEHIDLDNINRIASIGSAFSMLAASPSSHFRVFGSMRSRDATIDLVQEVRHIQTAMWRYAQNILILSLLISAFAACLVYLALYRLIVRPIVKISGNMDDFSKAPENAALIYQPTQRRDEIGIAESRLAAFQHELQQTLKQKQHLADLGLAVAKINHDLRNILASAQLFSDRLSTLPDPNVQRFAPKLIRAIDRAVDYTKSVIDYGRALEAPPNRRALALRNLVDDVAELLGIGNQVDIDWENRVDANLEADADPEHLFRVLLNLCRNAHQAMGDMRDSDRQMKLWIDARREDSDLHIAVCDTGPGIPDHVREKIFNAFQGSTKAGGSGLGITIAAELVQAHGGSIHIHKSDEEGTHFHITIPDSPSRERIESNGKNFIQSLQ